MSTAPSGNEAPLLDWIRAWVAQNMGLAGPDIALDASFVNLGLDSVHAMMLVGDLEEHLGRRLAPTLAWDHPTISAMAAHLAGNGSGTLATTADSEMMDRLEDLPEEELDRLLRERLNPDDPK